MRNIKRSFLAAIFAALVLPSLALAYWPVANQSSYVSQWYHTGHYGIDIATPSGTKVLPMKYGVVVFAGWRSNCGGYQVWVSHGSGLYSAYYHLRSEVSTKGEPVYGQKTVLGYSGMSGCATGPHVHVEVWRGYPWASGSYRVNPWTYLASGYYFPLRYQ
ncbi:MAG: M23 family metallopeptidase [Candidatus Limnocylindrales bacterium]